MDRLPPFDQIGVTPVPDFVNASPSSGIPGSIINAAIFNQLQHELVNLITGAGLTPDSTNLTQVLAAVEALISTAVGGVSSYADSSRWHIGTAGGTANTITSTLSPAPAAGATSYYSSISFTTTNTGAATLNGASIVIDATGTALIGGEIRTTGRSIFFFDGIVQRLLNPSRPSIHEGNDTSGTANQIVANVLPAITAYTAGERYQIKLANDITASGAVANFCSVGNRTIVRADGTPTQSRDGVAGQILDVIDDGTHLQIVGLKTPNSTIQAQFATTGSASTSNATTTTAALAAVGTLPPWCSVTGGIVTILQAGRYDFNAYFANQGYLPSSESAYAGANLVINGTPAFPSNAGGVDVYLPSGSTLYAADDFSYSAYLAAGSTVKLTAVIGSSNADMSSCVLSSAFLNIVKGG